uniref:Uncharacterized protein n=1 Tax=Magallana gigas TaxID=29159 RepID=K1PET7_MAGGI
MVMIWSIFICNKAGNENLSLPVKTGIDSDPLTDSEYVICFKIDQGVLEKLSVKVLKREPE